MIESSMRCSDEVAGHKGVSKVLLAYKPVPLLHWALQLLDFSSAGHRPNAVCRKCRLRIPVRAENEPRNACMHSNRSPTAGVWWPLRPAPTPRRAALLFARVRER